jgi:hypothetical protein
MDRKWQFSLAFLLIEVACIGVALSLFRAVSLFEMEPIAPLFLVAAIAVSGTAIGAWFGKPALGAALAVAVLLVVALFLPRVH